MNDLYLKHEQEQFQQLNKESMGSGLYMLDVSKKLNSVAYPWAPTVRLQKMGASEALNVDVSPVWDAQTAVTTSNTDTATITIDKNKYHKIAVTATNPIIVSFSTASNYTIDATNDLLLYGAQTHYLNVPDLGDPNDSIYFCFRRNGSTNSTVTSVLM